MSTLAPQRIVPLYAPPTHFHPFPCSSSLVRHSAKSSASSHTPLISPHQLKAQAPLVYLHQVSLWANLKYYQFPARCTFICNMQLTFIFTFLSVFIQLGQAFMLSTVHSSHTPLISPHFSCKAQAPLVDLYQVSLWATSLKHCQFPAPSCATCNPLSFSLFFPYSSSMARHSH